MRIIFFCAFSDLAYHFKVFCHFITFLLQRVREGMRSSERYILDYMATGVSGLTVFSGCDRQYICTSE